MRKAGIWSFIVLLNLVVVLMALDTCKAGLADLARDTSKNLQEAQASLQQTAQEMKELKAANEKDLNNKKLYENTFSQQYTPAIAAYKKKLENYRAAEAERNQRVAAHNAAYGGKKLPPGEYEVSQRSKEKLDREEASLANILDKITQEKHALKRKCDPIFKEVDAIKARVNDRSSKLTALKNKFDQVESRLQGLRQTMINTCKEAQKRKDPGWEEALKYCHSVNWDGARQNLPPLTDPAPPFRMTPN